MEGTKGNNHYVQESCAPDEYHEVLVVPFPYASAKPWAMVVKALDTTITNAAMDSPRRPVNITSGAVLNFR